MTFDDILYDKQDGIATITINRPKALNPFYSQTVDEMVAAFQDAWADRRGVLPAEIPDLARPLLADHARAIKIAKASFNAETNHIRGISALGMSSLALYYATEEAMEGRNAFIEKRKPDFRKYRR